jgi:hypothetical protein
MKPKMTTISEIASSQPSSEALVNDLRGLILSARQTVTCGTNATQVWLYW